MNRIDNIFHALLLHAVMYMIVTFSIFFCLPIIILCLLFMNKNKGSELLKQYFDQLHSMLSKWRI